MILIDFSSIIHRMIHTSVANIKPAKKDGKYITSQFVGLMKYFILQDLFNIHREHGNKFGDLIICLDKSSNGYWRKDFYPGYKNRRKAGRDESEVDYGEIFADVNGLIEQMKINLPWKVLEVDKAEADDIMLVLAKEFSPFERVMIHSPDKDMIQAQRYNDNVFQYSSLTKKWLVPENKHTNMDHWIMEHVCLGDASDDVPKVVDHTEFSSNFLAYVKDQGFNIKDPMEFRQSNIENDEKRRLLIEFDIFKTNRKGESTGVKDVYKDMRFGPTTLEKAIATHGSLDKWLDSHPMYREHYDRNFVLVMDEGIPTNIWNECVLSYKTADTQYNNRAFEEYCTNNELKSILMDLPSIFKIQGELTAEDFNW